MTGPRIDLRKRIGKALGFGQLDVQTSSSRDLVWSLTALREFVHGYPGGEKDRFLIFLLENIAHSRSQIFQDLFVLFALGSPRNGFFCDFGATNGVFLSNSHYLEHGFGWRGICAEPARNWHADLRANRPNAIIETDCVWSSSGQELSFRETAEKELSTIDRFARRDGRNRKDATVYSVRTVSLNDLLRRNDAPRDFDYLSVDTEGSEFDILNAFDLSHYRPKVMTIEHNHTPARAKIHDLLSGAGYRRVLEKYSQFDDWYVAPGIGSFD